MLLKTVIENVRRTSMWNFLHQSKTTSISCQSEFASGCAFDHLSSTEQRVSRHRQLSSFALLLPTRRLRIAVAAHNGVTTFIKEPSYFVRLSRDDAKIVGPPRWIGVERPLKSCKDPSMSSPRDHSLWHHWQSTVYESCISAYVVSANWNA